MIIDGAGAAVALKVEANVKIAVLLREGLKKKTSIKRSG